MNFVKKAEFQLERRNPRTGKMGVVQMQQVFINYPGAVDTIRFTVHQMDQYAQNFERSVGDQEEILYYCPPRTVQRMELQPQKKNKKKGKCTDVTTVTKDEFIGCANSGIIARRQKRYSFAEYMKAQVQEWNDDTNAFEYRHYCPLCYGHALKQGKLTVGYEGRSAPPVLVPYTVAAVGIGELDEVLAPIRLLLDNVDLDPERICIPVENNGCLFEGAMDKFLEREKMQKSRHSGAAERVQQCVLVTVTDSTRIIAENTPKEEKSLADKQHEYCILLSSHCATPCYCYYCLSCCPFSASLFETF